MDSHSASEYFCISCAVARRFMFLSGRMPTPSSATGHYRCWLQFAGDQRSVVFQYVGEGDQVDARRYNDAVFAVGGF